MIKLGSKMFYPVDPDNLCDPDEDPILEVTINSIEMLEFYNSFEDAKWQKSTKKIKRVKIDIGGLDNYIWVKPEEIFSEKKQAMAHLAFVVTEKLEKFKKKVQRYENIIVLLRKYG